MIQETAALSDRRWLPALRKIGGRRAALTVVVIAGCLAPAAPILAGDALPPQPPAAASTHATLKSDIPESMRACAQCHGGVVEAYLGHGMAHSVGQLGPVAPGEASNPATGQNYRVTPDADGARLTARFADGGTREQRLVGRIGAGKLATSWIGTEVEPTSGLITGRLFFAPLETIAGHGYRLAPFELHSAAGSLGLPLTDDCLSCHTRARSANLISAATPISATGDPFPRNHLGADAFDQLSPLGCDACHGEVSGHMDVILGRAKAAPGGVGLQRLSDLPAAGQRDICARCHLQGDVRIDLVEGRIDPHVPLAGQIPVLTTVEPTEDFRFVSQLERLSLSACFAGSPQMTCTTCHRPHQGAAEQGVASFDTGCKACHADLAQPHTSVTVEAVTGEPARSKSGCVDCHVRRSQPFDLPHVRSADHRIQRRIAPPDTDLPHRQFGDRQAALRLFDAERLSPALDTESGQLWLDGVMAMGLASMGRFDEARARFARFPAPGTPQAIRASAPAPLTALEPVSAFHTLRASLLMAEGKLEEARSAYSDALRLNPLDATALLGRARLNLDLGDLGAALRDSQTVIDTYPSAEQPWQLRLEIAERHNRPDLALAALNAITRHWPSDASHWLKKAILLRRQGAIAESDQALDQVRRLQPSLMQQVPAELRGD